MIECIVVLMYTAVAILIIYFHHILTEVRKSVTQVEELNQNVYTSEDPIVDLIRQIHMSHYFDNYDDDDYIFDEPLLLDDYILDEPLLLNESSSDISIVDEDDDFGIGFAADELSFEDEPILAMANDFTIEDSSMFAIPSMYEEVERRSTNINDIENIESLLTNLIDNNEYKTIDTLLWVFYQAKGNVDEILTKVLELTLPIADKLQWRRPNWLKIQERDIRRGTPEHSDHLREF